jgi:hypothetical protein
MPFGIVIAVETSLIKQGKKKLIEKLKVNLISTYKALISEEFLTARNDGQPEKG